MAELPDWKQRVVQPGAPETGAPRSPSPATEPAIDPSYGSAPPAPASVTANEGSAESAPDPRIRDFTDLVRSGKFSEALQIAKQAEDPGETEFFSRNFRALASLVQVAVT